jgi:phosphate-selective porin OprO/OprP
MKLNQTITLAAILASQIGLSGVRIHAQDVDVKALLRRIEELEQKVKALESQRELDLKAKEGQSPAIEELDQKVKILARNAELDKEAAAAKSKQVPQVSIGANGLAISSADTNFVFKLRGGFQVDGRFYPGTDSPAGDTFLLRRARPTMEGTVYDKFDYRLMLDFGSGISSSAFNNANLLDAYINYRLFPELQLRIGKFKEPVGLERLQSWNNLLFVERGLPTFLVPNRDTGIQLHGEIGSGLLQYALGGFNGTSDGGSSDFDTENDKDLAARIMLHPFKRSGIDALRGLGFGVSGTYGRHEGSLRNYFTLGQQQFFTWYTGAGTNAATRNVTGDGTVWRVSPQGYYYWGPFGLFGEYVISSQEVQRAAGGAPTQATLRNTGWQVAASWFLTGEENSYGQVQPKKNFDPLNGSWGSLELAARVGALDIDEDAFPLFADPTKSASGIFSWGVGLNWRLNPNVKLSLNYEHAELDGVSGNNAPFKDEHVIFTRAQFAF